MALHYRTQGFILKKTDRGEADQVLTVYTKDFGKLEILGRAIRKIKSKLRSGADLFYFSEIEFIQGKAYKTLTDAILIEKFKNLRENLEKMKIAYQMSDALNNLVSEHEKDEEIWCLLMEVFEKLNNKKLKSNPSESPSGLPPEGVQGNSLKIIYYYFLWNLISILGYQIDLYKCAICQQKLSPQKLYFNLQEGGIIDLNCFKKIKKGDPISPEVIKILRLFLKKDWKILFKLKTTEEQKKMLQSVSETYFSHHNTKRIVKT